MCVSHKYAPPPTEGEGNIVFFTDPVGMTMTTRYLKNLLADFDQIFLDVTLGFEEECTRFNPIPSER